MRERALIAQLLAPIARQPAARGLLDDAAVLTPPLGRDLVLAKDMLAEGVHFLTTDPPGDIAAKLVAVNLSDLAAMGARPVGLLLGLGLADQEDAWLTAFAAGLGEATERWGAPLLGGDTVRGLPRLALSLTAIGQVAPGRALSRSGAKPGDILWVSGAIGDAALGLTILKDELAADEPHRSALIARYRRPEPRLALGHSLAGVASACLDISDGLLIDAERLAKASDVAVTIELARLPRSRAAEAVDADAMTLATGGDDYELLFTAPPRATESVTAIGRQTRTRITAIGHCAAGNSLIVLDENGQPITPARLGWEH